MAAGRNFGCGSSREQAPIAIKYAGISAILAKSYSRIFFRNAVNQGIPCFLCDTDDIVQDDTVTVNIGQNFVELAEKGKRIPLEPLSPVMLDILREGGLVEYLKKTENTSFPGDPGGKEKECGSGGEFAYPCGDLFSKAKKRKTDRRDMKMKFRKSIFSGSIIAVLAAVLLFTGTAQAEVHLNMGSTSSTSGVYA